MTPTKCGLALACHCSGSRTAVSFPTGVCPCLQTHHLTLHAFLPSLLHHAIATPLMRIGNKDSYYCLAETLAHTRVLILHIGHFNRKKGASHVVGWAAGGRQAGRVKHSSHLCAATTNTIIKREVDDDDGGDATTNVHHHPSFFPPAAPSPTPDHPFKNE